MTPEFGPLPRGRFRYFWYPPVIAPATTPQLSIPRATYGLIMAGATVAGLACAAAVASGLGGSGEVVRYALIALAVGSIATFVPAMFLISAEYWGVAVLFSGVARGLIVVAISYFITQGNPDLSSKALFYGSISGAGMVLFVETATAIVMLSKVERTRQALKLQNSNSPATSAADRT